MHTQTNKFLTSRNFTECSPRVSLDVKATRITQSYSFAIMGHEHADVEAEAVGRRSVLPSIL